MNVYDPFDAGDSMLHVNNLTNKQAKRYYSKADYYTTGNQSQETIGSWLGEGARKLGLVGRVDQKSFADLIDNINPLTGKKLTQRIKANRRVAFDITMDVSKSVSIIHALGKDARIDSAFAKAARDSIREMEEYAAARVRDHGQNTDRITGNLIIAEFKHETARPVGGVPDCHLHRHFVVINATMDEDSGQWKALENRHLKELADYFQASYHARLAANLRELGYALEAKGKCFEIRGVPSELIEEFSQRDKVIRAERRKRGITSDKEAARLAVLTRESKAGELTLDELDGLWLARTTPEQQKTLLDVVERAQERQNHRTLNHVDRTYTDTGEVEQRALDFALRHCLERKSVVSELDLYAAALQFAVVDHLDTRKLKALLESHPNLIRSVHRGQLMITTPEVLAEERALVEFAQNSRDTLMPLARGRIRNSTLTEEQRRASEHILNNTDRVTGVAGRAGVGKTTMLLHTVAAIEANGHRVMAFAPTSEASRGVLRDQGFANANTVSSLLVSPRIQAEARGAVWLIDEAGLMSTPMMAQVFDLAERLDARIILSGDSKQHAAVERGEALRLLETRGAVDMASMSTVRRQSGIYKEVVELLSQEKTTEAFEKLDSEMKAIIELDDDSRHTALANDYMEAVRKEHTALIVAPTHAEIAKVTDAIREQLKEKGGLKREREVFSLKRMDMTASQRQMPINYTEGSYIQFMRPAKGIRTGERLEVINVLPGGVVVRNAQGHERLLDVEKLADRFQVYEKEELPVGQGERIRITQNTKFNGHELRNGGLHTVVGFDSNGGLKLDNGITLPPEFGHITHGYAVTSHVGQGRTVDYMFVAESADSLAGASLQQFYVSVSRGRYGVKIYTDDREALLDAVCQSRERLLAMDFVHPLPLPDERQPTPYEIDTPVEREEPRPVEQPVEQLEERTVDPNGSRSWLGGDRVPRRKLIEHLQERERCCEMTMVF